MSCWPQFGKPRHSNAGGQKPNRRLEKRKIEAVERFNVDINEGGWAKIFMPYLSSNSNLSPRTKSILFSELAEGTAPVGSRFLAPLENVLPRLRTSRECTSLPDPDWLALGVLRVLHDSPSGRGFLQQVGANLPNCPDFNLFFANLRSERRLALCQEADRLLTADLKARLPDQFADIEELAGFDVYAGDGHWHQAAAHDRAPQPESPKSACGHFFALSLRSGTLEHITTADQEQREHEHDMRALKRQTIESLRRGARKGRKVLYVWDRAGIDFQAWQRWKHTGGVYFLSREKDNLSLSGLTALPWEQADPRNHGVLCDEKCQSASGVALRRIAFQDPVTLIMHVFLTNEMTLPPGILVELARRRWDIEKVFDELKNKLGETRAWASSSTAKSMQAAFVCLAHQLLLAFEVLLSQTEDIRPQRELDRRAQRIHQEQHIATRNRRHFPSLRAAALRLTQRTVKFLRWLRACITTKARWHDLLAILRHSYASG